MKKLIIQNQNKSINEHLWSGIIHRSETGENRKEDQKMKDVVDFLSKHYIYEDSLNHTVLKIKETPINATFFTSKIEIETHLENTYDKCIFKIFLNIPEDNYKYYAEVWCSYFENNNIDNIEIALNTYFINVRSTPYDINVDANTLEDIEIFIDTILQHYKMTGFRKRED